MRTSADLLYPTHACRVYAWAGQLPVDESPGVVIINELGDFVLGEDGRWLGLGFVPGIIFQLF